MFMTIITVIFLLFKDLDARIIITEVSIIGARSVFCEVSIVNSPPWGLFGT